MKINRGSASRIGLASLALFSLLASARADTFTATFTNGFGDAIWTRDAHIGQIGNPNDPDVPGNWSTGAYPSNNHSIFNPNNSTQVPGPSPLYDVVINISTPCTLDGGNVIVQSVAIGSSSTLNIVFPRLLTVTPGGTVNNQGVINLSGDLDFPSGSVTLTGGGTINFDHGRFVEFATLTNVNNLIQGETDAANNGLGNGQTTIINQANGVIDANVSGRPFLVYPNGTGGLSNAGILRATNGGILEFTGSGGTITNTGAGIIQAFNGSEVQLFNNAAITGGTLATSGTGVIRTVTSSFLTNVTNSGTFVVNDNGFVRIAGTLNNTGSISLNATVNFADIWVDGNVTLTGGGTINMTKGSRFILGDILTNHNNTIQGETDASSGGLGNGQTTIVNQVDGVIDANVSGRPFLIYPDGGGFTNAGMMKATNGGILEFTGSGGPITNTGAGTIQASNGSEVQLFNSVSIVGGTLATTGTGLFRTVSSASLTNVTSSATFTTSPNFFTSLSGAITNNGTMTFENNSRLQFHATTTLGGTGAVVLANSAIMYVSGQAATNGSGHTIKGNGTILIDGGGTFTNNGIVSPGLSPGKLTVSGNYTQGSTGVLNLEIGGNNPATEYDQLAVTGTAGLNGTLKVTLIDGFRPHVGDTFQIMTYAGFTGAFSTFATVGFTAQVTYTATGITVTVLTVPDIPLNISTRLRVLNGDNVLIGGFIITGSQPKKVIIRAIGPSLGAAGVPGSLADPTLELHGASPFVTVTNDNWRTDQEAEIIASTIPPTNDLEAAIVATLAPGAYTAVVAGINNGVGVGLVEIFDLDQAARSKLANISTRGFVDTGNNVMIGGFIIGGNGQANGRIVLRAIGPSLTAAGIPNALQDPILELHDANGSTLLLNDDWQSSQQAEIEATGLAPTDVRESAIVMSLPDGNYTAVVRGQNNTTGVAVVEGYNIL